MKKDINQAAATTIPYYSKLEFVTESNKSQNKPTKIRKVKTKHTAHDNDY
jgi:hypothetical protein